MTENRKPIPRDFDDEVPDLSAPEWQAAFAKAQVQRGRPRSPNPKVSTTIRLSPEVLDYFRASGPGWQTRIDETLRKAAGIDR